MSKLRERLDIYQKRIVHFMRTQWKLIILAIVAVVGYFYFPTAGSKVVIPPYFKQNRIGILIVVLGLTVILVVSKLYNIKFKKKKKKVSKVIVVEKMTNVPPPDAVPRLRSEDGGFCDRGSESLENSCGELLERPCMMADCCAWAKRNGITKCITGKEDGATFKTDEKGNKYKFDFYYFKEKKTPVSKLI